MQVVYDRQIFKSVSDVICSVAGGDSIYPANTLKCRTQMSQMTEQWHNEQVSRLGTFI